MLKDCWGGGALVKSPCHPKAPAAIGPRGPPGWDQFKGSAQSLRLTPTAASRRPPLTHLCA